MTAPSSGANVKRLIGLGPELSQLGIDVSILLERNPSNIEVADANLRGVRVVFFDGLLRVLGWQQMRRILSEKPDYVWLYSVTWWHLLPIVILRRQKFIVDHAELVSCFESFPAWKRAIFKLLERYFVRRATGNVYASRYLERHFSKISRTGQGALYLPFAYQDSWVDRSRLNRTDLDSRVKTKKTILYFGGLWRSYGIFDILESCRLLNLSGDEFFYCIAGSGPELEPAKEFVRDNGLEHCVRLLGFIDEDLLAAYSAAADVFVCPLNHTIQDIARCPSKLFMFLPFDKPVVTCAVGEAVEVFGNSYRWFYESGDPASMAETVREALERGSDWKAPWLAQDHSWSKRSTVVKAWIESL